MDIMIENLLPAGGCAIDATTGNGLDLLKLSNKVGGRGKVFGFDIQETAIDKTKALLKSKAVHDNYILIQDCHSQLLNHVREPVDMAVYNLGYLPGGDKAITTRMETTILSLKAAMTLLKTKGCLMVVSYPGHPKGAVEEKALFSFSKALNQNIWTVLRSEFTNQINDPPIFYLIMKR